VTLYVLCIRNTYWHFIKCQLQHQEKQTGNREREEREREREKQEGTKAYEILQRECNSGACLVGCVCVSSQRASVSLMMETIRSSETSVLTSQCASVASYCLR
jgi:hypothetical protein